MPTKSHPSRPRRKELPRVAASCPLQLAINTIGGRWKLSILRTLFVDGAQRYNLLQKSVAGISAKELTRNLRELENAGLVIQQARDSARVYTLTPFGEQLLPTFRCLGEFGAMLAESRQRHP